ncbi:unnamed protein product, partial [Rotaria sp. Silwood2]
MFGRNLKLYSKSYLGYDLTIAWILIFINETTDGNQIATHQLTSKFIPHGLVGKFIFQGIKWNVQSFE